MKSILCSLTIIAGLCHLSASEVSQPAYLLDPRNWPDSLLQSLELEQSQSWTPAKAGITISSGGLISATVSPLAVEAGKRALAAGGTAADAAATVALTQVTTELGSVVSFGGIMTALYYDAETGQVTALDAGYDSYEGELDPASIPNADLGPLRPDEHVDTARDFGRMTLVPGFMAGIEALQGRFGKLPFGDLFIPSISFAEDGVTVSPILESFFNLRAQAFQRTEGGRAFLAQSGRQVPVAGDRFVQAELAKTLRAVAENGSSEMYRGEWARHYVEVVRREGGNITADDMAFYQPTWAEPYCTDAFGSRVFITPLPNAGAYGISLGLHLAEELGFNRDNSLFDNPRTWASFSRIAALASTAPGLDPAFAAMIQDEGMDISPGRWLSKSFAHELAPRIFQMQSTSSIEEPRHSNSIAVVDKWGNICVITHTINAVIWGGSGIVVGGIPVPDSAGFQQARLAYVKPGDRVPHEIVDTIVLKEGVPVLATASIGSSLAAESLRILIGRLAHQQSLSSIMSAPTHLSRFGPTPLDVSEDGFVVLVPEGSYSEAFLSAVKAEGVQAVEVPPSQVDALRGTVSAISLDDESGKWVAVEQPGVMVFNTAE